jgi:predicted ABC-type ATPase
VAFETTMASRSFAPWIERLVTNGYAFRVVFLWLPSPELAITRVRQRVALGGHSVPDSVIRRRYSAGLRNFYRVYSRLADSWAFYDASELFGQHLVAQKPPGRTVNIVDSELWSKLKERWG